jgi:hypothetical protein
MFGASWSIGSFRGREILPYLTAIDDRGAVIKGYFLINFERQLVNFSVSFIPIEL